MSDTSRAFKCFFLRICSSCSSFWTTGEFLEIYDILGEIWPLLTLVPIGNIIFRGNFAISCIFPCQRHIISWAPFDLRENLFDVTPYPRVCNFNLMRKMTEYFRHDFLSGFERSAFVFLYDFRRSWAELGWAPRGCQVGADTVTARAKGALESSPWDLSNAASPSPSLHDLRFAR